MNKRNIGGQLRALRKAKNLTTQELADKVSISQSYISRFENNRAIPDIDMLDRILTVLNSSLAAFFADEFQDMPEDLIQLINTVKMLSPEARMKLNDFLKIMNG